MFGGVEMELFGIVVAIFSGILTYQTWKNGRWMKQTHEDTKELIKEESRLTREMIAKISEKMDDTLKEIAHLIVAEGEKTRQAVKT